MFQKYTKETEEQMRVFYGSLSEKEKRRYAALEVEKLGYGGQRYICSLLGCSPTTVRVGRAEIVQGESGPEKRIRRKGGGRKKIQEKIANIDEVFLEIVKEQTAGSPMDETVKWTNLGQKDISKAFEARGYQVSEHVVKQLLEKHHYVKRKMRKTTTMKETKQRNEQFENIKEIREKYAQSDNPVVSIDGKKRANRELLSRGERILY